MASKGFFQSNPLESSRSSSRSRREQYASARGPSSSALLPSGFRASSGRTQPERSTVSDPNNNTSDRSPNDGQQNEAASASGQKLASSDDGHDAKPAPPDVPNSNASWYRRVATKYGSVSLENKGSVARDHLALERTFLAWLRTSLAFASIGIAITQLFRLNTTLAKHEKRQRDSYPDGTTLDPGRGGGGAGLSLPFSPLMGASLTPETFFQVQQALVLRRSGEDAVSSQDLVPRTLFEHLLTLHPRDYDSGAAAGLRHIGKPLGATFLGISIIILLIGFRRYFESQHWIIRGYFPASRGSVAVTGLIAGLLIVASLAVVLAVAPGAYRD
jgi:uncharacterized membrane protein YidH (DUF202 family)